MKQYLILFVCAITLWSCGGGSGEGDTIKLVAKGDRSYGGVFRINEVEDFRNLYPLNITEVTSHRITNQVYEGLVKLSQKDLSVMPSIAERYEVNEAATSFTFYL